MSEKLSTPVVLALPAYEELDEGDPGLSGWRMPVFTNSLPEAFASVTVPPVTAAPWKKFLAFSGLGAMISVGYMDPGNWATGLAGGSQFGYTLLSVILVSNVAAIILQHLALKLGVASGRDLAQACRDAYPRWLCITLWLLAEVGIVACDLAEVIGSAVAIMLLTGLPLWLGVVITAADVLLVLLFEAKNFRVLEVFVELLIATIAGCFLYEIVMAGPTWADVALGLVPKREILTNSEMLFVAVGILGATVMPHNLYLHSSVIQTRNYPRTSQGKRMAIFYGTLDSTLSLLVAFFINGAILTLAAAAFHYREGGPVEVADITDAYKLLSGALGARAASIVFAVALLASGQNSTVTATLAGQVVMEGFLHFHIRPWMRRLITRMMAIVPAVVVAASLGNQAVGRLLLTSQVVLSLQLPFAVVPLVHFTCSQKFTGRFANKALMRGVAIALALLVVFLNCYLLVATFAQC